MASEQSSRRREGAGEAGSGGNSRHSAGPAMTETGQGCRFDISYLRSLEGILRAISFGPALLGVLLAALSSGGGAAGWFIFVGVSYIIYTAIVFVVEILIPNINLHKLVDGVIMGVYTLLWMIAAAVATTYAACYSSGKLGVASAMGFLCCVLTGIIAFIVIRTWLKSTWEGQHSTLVI